MSLRRLALLLLLVALAACVTPQRQRRAQARVDLGRAYLVEGSVDMAVATLTEATELDPRNVAAWNQLGLALAARGDFERAEQAFRRALRLDPDGAEVNLNYAFLLQKQGRHAEAIPYLERALEDMSYRNPVFILNNLGYALLQTGRVDRAVATLRDAVRRAPNNCRAWFNLGLALERTSHPLDAKEAYERVRMICPEQSYGARARSAYLDLDAGRVEAGCAELAALLGEGDDHPVAAEVKARYAAACEGR